MIVVDKPDIVKTLRQNGYRATPQRLAIYDALWNAGSHPSVYEIHAHVEKRDPTISKATVYKTLQLFVEIGIVNEMGFKDESTRYDPDMGLHINLICINCGEVEDFLYQNLDGITPDLEQKRGFQVVRHRFEVHGICSRCRNESNK